MSKTELKQPRFLSLFSGCGGLDLGFIQAGFKGHLSVDIDQASLAVHERNLNCKTARMDLTEADPEISRREKIDVLLAGSPCQGFSTAGARRLDDPRNKLMLVAPRVAAKLRPKVFVAENVPGALAGAHRVYWDRLHSEMSELGYQTLDLHLNSSDFGVAQARKRVMLVAWRTGKSGKFQPISVGRKVLRDVLNNVESAANHDPVYLVPGTAEFIIASRIHQGQKLTNARNGDRAVHTWDIPEVFGKTTKKERELLDLVLKLRRQERRRDFGDADPVSSRFLTKKFGSDVLNSLEKKNYLRKIGHYHDLTNTFNGKFRRLEENEPSRTVDTRFGDFRLFLHPKEQRGFTVREAARIQGFPDDFVFEGSIVSQFKMIGNAVPPPMAKEVAEFVKTLL